MRPSLGKVRYLAHHLTYVVIVDCVPKQKESIVTYFCFHLEDNSADCVRVFERTIHCGGLFVVGLCRHVFVEGYHGDEHNLTNQHLLINRLLYFNSDGAEANYFVISLTIGPKLITSKPWRPALETLTTCGLIQMIVIGEVYYICQSGLFCPEFGVMVSFLDRLLAMMPPLCPRLLLLATIHPADIDECAPVFCGILPNVLDGPLDRRRISFKLMISEDAARSIRKYAPC